MEIKINTITERSLGSQSVFNLKFIVVFTIERDAKNLQNCSLQY